MKKIDKWSDRISILLWALAIGGCFLMFGHRADAAENVKVDFTWTYKSDVPGHTGFKLFVDGVEFLAVNQKDLRQTQHIFPVLKEGSRSFTMTATGEYGSESEMSPSSTGLVKYRLPKVDNMGAIVYEDDKVIVIIPSK
jgi:hypothetical protein